MTTLVKGIWVSSIQMRRGSFIFGLAVSTCIHGVLFAALREGIFGETIARANVDDGLTTTLTFSPVNEALVADQPPPPESESTTAAPLVAPPPPPPPPIETSPEPPPIPEPEPLKAGIDDGAQDAKGWQGFKEETANAAPVSEVEQSAMTPKQGLDPQTVPPQPQAEPTEVAKESPAAQINAQQPTPAEAPVENQNSEAPREEPKQEGMKQPEEAPREAVESVPAPIDGEIRPPVKDATIAPESAPAQDLRPASTVDVLAPAAATGAGSSDSIEPAKAPEAAAPKPIEAVDEPAIESSPKNAQDPSVMQALREVRAEVENRKPSIEGMGIGEIEPEESDAAALKPSLAVEPGKTLARDGIQIRTSRPNWSITTKITAVPRNPVLDVTFDRAGKVTKAAFVSGRNTGTREVDGPLLDSVYRWRASGANFDKSVLQTGTVTLRFRMLLKEEDDSNRLPIPADKAR